MENRENIVTNDLRWAKNDSNKIIQTSNDGNNLWKNNKPQRTALGNLSANTSFRSSQTRTKPPTLSILYDKNRISTSDKASKTIVAGSPRQAFTIYIDQELENDSQSLKDIAIHDIDDEKKSSPTVINYIDDTCDVNCDEENIPVPDIVHVPDSDGNFAKTGLPEYETEIHDYFKEAERRHRPNRNFMNGQPLINKSMRAILVDWLVEVAEEYRLVPETLYLTVNYIDRFLSSKVVIAPSKLQLVGVSCMLIASKIEEIYPPEVSEFVYITNSTYTGDQVKEMEKFVLKLLAFDLAVPTALSFLDHYEKGVELPGGLSQKFSHLTRYYCELALLDSDIQWTYLPSAVAASSVVLALSTNGFTSWFPLLSENTGFELSDLETCIDDMHKVVLKAVDSKLQSIRDKYSEPRFSSVASIMTGKPPFP